MDQSVKHESLRHNIVFNQGEKLDENLLCMICQELVMDPIECEECQCLFCNICMTEWLKKKSSILKYLLNKD